MSDGKSNGIVDCVDEEKPGAESGLQAPKIVKGGVTRRKTSTLPCISKASDFSDNLTVSRAARASVAVGEEVPGVVKRVGDPLVTGGGHVPDGITRVVPDSDDEALVSTKLGVLAGTTAATPDLESLGANASHVQLATVHGTAEASHRGNLGDPKSLADNRQVMSPSGKELGIKENHSEEKLLNTEPLKSFITEEHVQHVRSQQQSTILHGDPALRAELQRNLTVAGAGETAPGGGASSSGGALQVMASLLTKYLPGVRQTESTELSTDHQTMVDSFSKFEEFSKSHSLNDRVDILEIS